MAWVKKGFLDHYNVYKDKIFTFFLYRVNFNRTIAEDLTSEVFLKALNHFTDYDSNRSFQAWIYRIAHNHLCNFYRSLNRETDLEQAAQLCVDFCGQSAVSLELEKVIETINELEDYHREVLLLRYADGLDNGEIAEVLGKEEGAVRTQVSRALAVLRGRLKNEKEVNS